MAIGGYGRPKPKVRIWHDECHGNGTTLDGHRTVTVRPPHLDGEGYCECHCPDCWLPDVGLCRCPDCKHHQNIGEWHADHPYDQRPMDAYTVDFMFAEPDYSRPPLADTDAFVDQYLRVQPVGRQHMAHRYAKWQSENGNSASSPPGFSETKIIFDRDE